MSDVKIQLVGDGFPLVASDDHPAGALFSGGYDCVERVLYAASVMGHPRGVSLADGDPNDENVSGLRVLVIAGGDIYWASDSMSLPRGLSDAEASEIQAALEKHFAESAIHRVEKLNDIPR